MTKAEIAIKKTNEAIVALNNMQDGELKEAIIKNMLKQIELMRGDKKKWRWFIPTETDVMS